MTAIHVYIECKKQGLHRMETSRIFKYFFKYIQVSGCKLLSENKGTSKAFFQIRDVSGIKLLISFIKCYNYQTWRIALD